MIIRHKDVKVGMRLKCVYEGIPDRIGKLATITAVSDMIGYINVKWDDGSTASCSWYIGNEKCFELYIPDDMS